MGWVQNAFGTLYVIFLDYNSVSVILEATFFAIV